MFPLLTLRKLMFTCWFLAIFLHPDKSRVSSFGKKLAPIIELTTFSLSEKVSTDVGRLKKCFRGNWNRDLMIDISRYLQLLYTGVLQCEGLSFSLCKGQEPSVHNACNKLALKVLDCRKSS